MSAIQTLRRLANAKCAIEIQIAVKAMRHAMGPPEMDGSDTAAQLNVLRMIERVSSRRANDPKVDASHVQYKPGVSEKEVQQAITWICGMAAQPASNADIIKGFDGEIVLYAAQRVLLPTFDLLGYGDAQFVEVTMEESANRMYSEFVSEGAYTVVTELCRKRFIEATEVTDGDTGRLPSDIKTGMRIKLVLAAKFIEASQPEVATCIKERRHMPERFTRTEEGKLALRMLLCRFIAPLVAHQLKATKAAHYTINSVMDVLVVNDHTKKVKLLNDEPLPARDPNKQADPQQPKGRTFS